MSTRPNEKRASRIALYRDGSIEDDAATKESIKEWAVDNLVRFKRVFSEKISEIMSG